MMDYSLLKEQMDALTGTQSRPIPNLANASALIWQMLGDINWAGFYLMERDTLYLGLYPDPFGSGGVRKRSAERSDTQSI